MPPATASLDRCIALIALKGGVGKTSIGANCGGQAAADGYSVLLVSLDPQDNLGEDLGYANAGLSDEGANLAAALLDQAPLAPLKDVRPNLDVIPGGTDLWGRVVIDYIRQDNPNPYLLRDALVPLADDYDLILIDCPPWNPVLQHLALVAARWMLIPTATDSSSRRGMGRLADMVADAAEHNPALGLLGVILFDVPYSGTRMREQTLAAMARDLGGRRPLLQRWIRTAPGPAWVSRERGQLIHELTGPDTPRSAKNVAEDYRKLTLEILQKLAKEEGTP